MFRTEIVHVGKIIFLIETATNSRRRIKMLSQKLFKKITVGLMLGVSVYAFSYIPSIANNNTIQNANSSAYQETTPNLADLVEEVSPAVVQVIAKGNIRSDVNQELNGFREFDGSLEELFKQFRSGNRFKGQRRRQIQPSLPSATGSGFIVKSDGIVITNNHVIKDASEVSVRLNDGRELPAKVIGSDLRTDLAVLQIISKEEFKYVNWGDSDNIRVGDSIFAMGSPFGLNGSVTSGIVSARGREIGSGPYDDFIQIDAPINSGNSGGPLFDLHGNVIGINTAIYSPSGGNVGIGFAIPSDIAKKNIR